MQSVMGKRVVIVTGAGRGIGAAISTRLAEAGGIVACVDLDEDGATRTAAHIRKLGGTADAFRCDVANADDVETTVEAIVERLGPPTVLINNAGITRDNLIFRMSDEDWDTVLSVHLRGSFLMTRAAQRHMVKAGYGRIVMISSTSALGMRGQTNYATAKAGLQGLTKALALELGPFGVTTNAVAPGFIITEMTRATAERIGQTFEEFTAARVAGIPVCRGGTPEDVAESVAFFASETAGFVNGQVLYVSGGPRT
jgi:3-oxoacyl-[acyl-carrier protein] reductase